MPAFSRRYNTDCWLDVYESTHFHGKLRRYIGPAEVPRLAGKSVIVGPGAKVQVIAQRGRKPVLIQLNPNRVIPNLPASLRGAIAQSAIVLCPLRSPRKPPKRAV
ncbi:MAG: hypothetical protein ABSF29_14740 [Tepidisphaeraceae bacterium]|jgi:hypothetical protein